MKRKTELELPMSLHCHEERTFVQKKEDYLILVRHKHVYIQLERNILEQQQ